jgi:hypothetical protein
LRFAIRRRQQSIQRNIYGLESKQLNVMRHRHTALQIKEDGRQLRCRPSPSRVVFPRARTLRHQSMK